ncbi:imidazolonepropionase [Flaviaesturariibacter flavus]|uniref:Imidazolonepropionase n=1 Tax=Flaviaesturariibacter flavus TaxID=2502780 RepID=A0A4R1BPD0_9BACT|nr:imidazolonepropionase [Flaviaesturariibacter flavus]TCJ19065.1 imidazolonepropionase [Flaviaesturariibacter flavus]
MNLLLTNIGRLAGIRDARAPLRGAALAELPALEDAYLIIEDDRIAAFGPMSSLAQQPGAFRAHIDCCGGTVLPAWVDSHTHLVFAGSREAEFVDKIRGVSYAEIAARGGGILNSARLLNETSEDELFRQGWTRLQELRRLGTGTIEIKSGYGLTVEGELRMLRVARRLREKSGMPVRSTFLGAHSFPAEYRDDREGYIRLIIEEMLPRIAAEGLADYIDVFCEENFFTPEQTIRICTAGRAHGLKPRLHANQLAVSGGVQAGIGVGAVSVDHLESMDDAAITALAGSDTMGTLLPTAAFFLRMPFQPARALADAGCALALASDFNPGSSPSGNMNLVVSMACIGMKLLPEEAINAATFNGACALEWQEQCGSIAVGKRADLILTRPIPSLAYLPYAFGSNLIEKVLLGGEPL